MSIMKEVFFESAIQEVWRAWTQTEMVTMWFAPAADIESFQDGKYELYYDPSNKDSMSTRGCRIMIYQEPDLLTFNWKGPDQFAPVMNGDNQLTLVSVRLEQFESGTKVILEHSGWGHTEEWDSAKQWHIAAWEQLFSTLKSKMESNKIK